MQLLPKNGSIMSFRAWWCYMFYFGPLMDSHSLFHVSTLFVNFSIYQLFKISRLSTFIILPFCFRLVFRILGKKKKKNNNNNPFITVKKIILCLKYSRSNNLLFNSSFIYFILSYFTLLYFILFYVQNPSRSQELRILFDSTFH
ncbi:hypothetical protein HMI56_001305 [Coelomomyces lativittatus]|nr:hypothetical protein HMI56_001305 [Coelomomyces lativittatus]